MKNKRTLFVFLALMVFVTSVFAAQSVAPGRYSFGGCGGINGVHMPQLDEEYTSRGVCETAYQAGLCNYEAESLLQQLEATGKAKQCENWLESRQRDCKKFMNSAAKRCAEIDLQNDTERESEPKPGSAKDRFSSVLQDDPSPGGAKEKFSSMANQENPENIDVAQRQANIDDMRHKMEQAKMDAEKARREAQEEAYQQQQRQAEYERQVEALRSRSSSHDDDSTDETLSTLGSVLLGVAQGVANAAGAKQGLNVPSYGGASSNGYWAKCRTQRIQAPSKCSAGDTRCLINEAETGTKFKTTCQ